MILSNEELSQRIKPLLPEAQRDPEGVTKALVSLVNQQTDDLKAHAPEDTSDGFHSFAELYMQRMMYNVALFNTWDLEGQFDVHKSWNHSDGQPAFGGGWFIVVAELPTGQISNHYEARYWDLFQIEDREIPAEYDGHTPQDALNRLAEFYGGEELNIGGRVHHEG